MNPLLNIQRVHSAYIFTGTDSLSLKEEALLFAKKLNCLSSLGLTEGSMCTCLSCKKIDRLVHPDVKWIESNDETIKIDTLRELQRELHLRPYEGKWKVAIINGAHHLNPASSNSLLKILEEPPKHSVFILLTPYIENLLPTIISRCHIIRLTCASQITFPPIEFLNDLLSLPQNAECRFELAKKISKDEATLKNCLEVFLTWYHDLLCFKQGLTPISSPLKEKETLAKNMCHQLTSQAIYDKLHIILEAKKNLSFQVNRELLSETLLLRLSQLTGPNE